VSIHGGHSKEFGDANDSTLKEVVRAYIDKGFKWVGITEHIPPASADFLFPWEIEEGQTLESRMERFTEYFSTAQAPKGLSRFHSHLSRIRNRELHGLRSARQQSAASIST
jgi:histidinol phosphatase-like PHP family hydrolase